MISFVNIPRQALVIALAMVSSASLVFSINGFFDIRIDAPVYAAQISSFAAGNAFSADPNVVMRLFKPLYGIIGGWLFHSAHPYGMILALNLFFYAVLAFATRRMLTVLDFSERETTIGALWIVTAYPVLKYGFALGTDMSGWALAALTVAVGLMALKKDSLSLLMLASVIGFLGAATKETGPLGLGIVGMLVILKYRKWGAKMILSRLAATCIPFIVLYGILFAAIAGQAPTLIDWFHANTTEYSGKHTYSLIKLIAVEGSTFGLYWIAALYAVIRMIRNRALARNIGYTVAGVLATLPILIWPLFISRILFIQFLWVMPLALYGYKLMSERAQARYPRTGRALMICLALAPIAFSSALFVLGAQGSLFSLMH